MEKYVGHREEDDVLHSGKGGGRVDALAYLHELHQHEKGEDGFAEWNDHGAMGGLDKVPDVNIPEERCETANDSGGIRSVTYDSEVGVPKGNTHIDKKTFHPVAQVIEDSGVSDVWDEQCGGHDHRHNSYELRFELEVGISLLQALDK